jgi:hypothetical protein
MGEVDEAGAWPSGHRATGHACVSTEMAASWNHQDHIAESSDTARVCGRCTCTDASSSLQQRQEPVCEKCDAMMAHALITKASSSACHVGSTDCNSLCRLSRWPFRLWAAHITMHGNVMHRPFQSASRATESCEASMQSRPACGYTQVRRRHRIMLCLLPSA